MSRTTPTTDTRSGPTGPGARCSDELNESTSLLAEGPKALREALRRDSYLFFRQLIPPAEVGQVADGALTALTDHRWIDGPTTMAPIEPLCTFGQPEYSACFSEIQSNEALHRLAHHDQLLAITSAICGVPEIVVHPRKIFRICFPQDVDPNGQTKVHQDFPYVQGGVDGLTVWIPLTPAPRHRGALEMLEGSASKGIQPYDIGVDQYGCAPALGRRAEYDTWRSADFEVGDVLLFHGLTVHASRPNLTGQIRCSVDFRYRAPSQPLGVIETWPQYYPDVGNWEHVTRNWSTQRWISVPHGTHITGLNLHPAGVVVGASELLGTAASATSLPRPNTE